VPAATIGQVLELCAQALANNTPIDQVEQPAQSLLRTLEYDSPADPGPFAVGSETLHRALLLHAAAQFTRLFQLDAPDAPGLSFFGAEIDPSGIVSGVVGHRSVSASGVGLSLRSAFEGCIGEGIEYLSQVETGQEGLTRGSLMECGAGSALAEDVATLTRQAGLADNAPLDWIVGQCLADGREVSLPADLCLRRDAGQRLVPPAPLSIGCAAAVSFEAAALHGLLELIERDAAALWWRGGRPGALVPFDHPAARAAVSTLALVRRDARRRRSWLIDITTDLLVPCVAAVSIDPGAKGFACGLSARLSLEEAAQGAILEMCQMELAHEVVAAKRRERGDEGLNVQDRAHLRRRDHLDVARCGLLHPQPPGVPIADFPHPRSLSKLVDHLASHGFPSFAVDLTRPIFGIPVVRVLCPGLEKEPSSLAGERLRAAIDATGGGDPYNGCIPLM
jgi:ribosomal protein S12 methylthiotransferase accessory factor